MTKREARELAFQIIFEKAFTDDSVETIIESAEECREVTFDDYSKKVAIGVFENIERIDDVIRKYCVGRSIERLSNVVLATLRLAIYEILYVESIGTGSAINEAVEIAKNYSTNKEAGFVNGVLGTFVRTEGLV